MRRVVITILRMTVAVSSGVGAACVSLHLSPNLYVAYGVGAVWVGLATGTMIWLERNASDESSGPPVVTDY